MFEKYPKHVRLILWFCIIFSFMFIFPLFFWIGFFMGYRFCFKQINKEINLHEVLDSTIQENDKTILEVDL